jgi:hypothetical protein
MDQPPLRALPPRTPPPHAPKARPDARPMRLALGAGGIAAMSALATAIILPPRPVTQVAIDPQAQAVDPLANPASQVQRPIRYVQLAPGQTAPPGATVINGSAPTPGSLVVTVTPAPQATQKRVVVKTSQSGKVIP